MIVFFFDFIYTQLFEKNDIFICLCYTFNSNNKGIGLMNIIVEEDMTIEELIELKRKAQEVYDAEKAKQNAGPIEGLDAIAGEISKIDSLIKIYGNPNIKYRIMKLERLYMMIVSGLSEAKFNQLNDDEMFEFFDNYIPDRWVFNISDEEKEQLLLDAISGNKIIELPGTKTIQGPNGE